MNSDDVAPIDESGNRLGITFFEMELYNEGISPDIIKQLINPKKFGQPPDGTSRKGHFIWPIYLTGGKLKTDLPKPWSGVSQDWKGIKGLDKDALELLKKMRDSIPYKWNRDKKPIRLTPLVLYYLTRYMGPILAGYTDKGTTNTWSDCVWKNLQFHPDRMKYEKRDKEDRIEAILDPEELYLDADININELFPFDRIKTTYSDEGNLDDVRYGLLQKYYSTLNSSARKGFVDNVWDNLIENLPEVKSILPGEPKRISDDYADAVAAFIQETDSATASSKKLKMYDDPYEESLVSIYTGAILEIPGLNLILAENAYNHNFFEGSLPDDVEWDIDLSDIEHMQGKEYLFNLIHQLTEHAIANDTDDLIIHLQEILGKTIEYSISMSREGKNVNAIVMSMEDEESFSTQINLSSSAPPRGSMLLRAKQTTEIKTDNPIPGLDGSSRKHSGFKRRLVGLITFEEAFSTVYTFLKNTGMDKEIAQDVKNFFFEAEEPVTIDGFFVGPTNYQTDEVEGWIARATTSGLPEASEEPSEAKQFAALGEVLETLMVKHAVEASKGAKKAPVSNIYDEIIASLVGNTRNPGLATYHALIHYNMLGAQLRTPLLKWKETAEKELMSGRLIAAEAWMDDPAKLLNMWMMNYRGYIDFGGWDEFTNQPLFFRMPIDPFLDEQSNSMMMNAFARLVIAYYRMSFKMLGARPVFIQPMKAGTEEAQSGGRASGTRYAEIKRYWEEMIRDSVNDPPKPGMFAMVLRFFADSQLSTGREKAGDALITPYPTWMPAPPETFDKAEMFKDRKMVTRFLKWAYGNKPMDMTNFSEIAAAYHASKVLSASDKYDEMIRMFLDAVSDDHGHPFLYAVLMNPNASANSSPPGKPPIDVNITNFQDLEISGINPTIYAQMMEKVDLASVPDEDEESSITEDEEIEMLQYFEDEEIEIEEEEKPVVQTVEEELDEQVKEETKEQKDSRAVSDTYEDADKDAWFNWQRDIKNYVDTLFERGEIDDKVLNAFKKQGKKFAREWQSKIKEGDDTTPAEAFNEWREQQQ